MAATAPPGHRPQLDSVRFLAFLGVFIFHFDEERLGYGALGVSLFFVLSGFLITRLLLLHETGNLRHDLGVFYLRRTLRIFPLYYLVLTVLLIAGRLPYPWWHFLYLHNVLMFLRPDMQPGPTGHFWSLSVEEQFYLLFPLLLYLTRPAWRVNLLLTLLVISLVSRVGLDTLYPNTRFWALLPVAGEYLVWGCLAGLFDVAQPSRPLPTALLLITGVLLHLVASVDQFGMHYIHRPGSAGLYQSLHGIGFALIILTVWRLPDGWLMRLLTLAPIVYLGKISYGLYVFHNFCYGVDRVLVERLPFLGVIPGPLLVFAVTVGLAMLSWHLFEAPINRLKGRVPYRAARVAPALFVPGVILVAGCQANPAPADQPAHRLRDREWVARHEALRGRSLKGGVDVAFLGDSITHFWEGPGLEAWQTLAPFRPGCYGIAGDRTGHVLWRIREGRELKGIDPRLVVLLIGTNNLDDGHSPEQIAGGVEAIVAELRRQRPALRILVLGLFPRGANPDDGYRTRIRETNAALRGLAKREAFDFEDLGEVFLEADGSLREEIMPDSLHLSPNGYTRWARSMLPELKKRLE